MPIEMHLIDDDHRQIKFDIHISCVYLEWEDVWWKNQ